MKIADLKLPHAQGIDFNLVEDAIIYMKNDPLFYRKEYYAAIVKLADSHRSGEQYDARQMLMPMIKNGVNRYCKQYKLANMPDDIFHDSDRQKIFDKIIEQEMKAIGKGDYK